MSLARALLSSSASIDAAARQAFLEQVQQQVL